MPPLVVPGGVGKKLRRKIMHILLNMSKNSRGRMILENLNIDGFARPDKSKYR